jgi:hypothetical protein
MRYEQRHTEDTHSSPLVVTAEPWRQDEWKEREVMSSPFVTVRFPDGEWALTLSENVPKVGDTLRRSGGKWVVARAAEDRNGHVIVTWRPASRSAN